MAKNGEVRDAAEVLREAYRKQKLEKMRKYGKGRGPEAPPNSEEECRERYHAGPGLHACLRRVLPPDVGKSQMVPSAGGFFLHPEPGEQRGRIASTQQPVDYSKVRALGAQDVRGVAQTPLSLTPHRGVGVPTAGGLWDDELSKPSGPTYRALGAQDVRGPAQTRVRIVGRAPVRPRGRIVGRAPARPRGRIVGSERHPGPIRATTQAEALARAFRTR